MEETNIIELKEIMKDLACEKLSHISDILKHKFGINNIQGRNRKEYYIFIEDTEEGICFKHTYTTEEIVSINIETEVYILRKEFSVCNAVEKSKEFDLQYAQETDMFDKDINVIKHEKYNELIKFKVEVNGYEVIQKESAMKIIEETFHEDLAKIMLSKQEIMNCGVVCFLDLADGLIKVVEDTQSLLESDIAICDLDKSWMFGGCIVDGMYIKEYEIAMLSSLLELGEYGRDIKEFYSGEEQSKAV